MENKQLDMQNEPDMEAVFNMLKENMPMPEENMKVAILNVLIYLLSM
ncbi:MAG: hypothetical protein HFI41_02885 [Lachnospiraceae bacterium]|nr:hypothetical protein [Lachnospiraceae bacterium]